ncbi:MAG: Nramp family divalent metal transporter [Gammaproteobacteria bacterium]|nr:Nramp family divalent metal transporter [Gammaproteobacteria bacterium]
MKAFIAQISKKLGLNNFGPGILVTAAFIGPGTVITASLAGANFGLALLWALLFAVLSTIILQEMTARLGIVTQQGLGENIRETFSHPVARGIAILLVVSAIVIGNGAYQGGNISGASLGLQSIFNSDNANINQWLWPILIGVIAFMLLWTGQYRLIEKALIFLVSLMSLSFLFTFIITQPNLAELFSGLLLPSIPDGATLTVIALIGTTVVPYNLFLHASSACQKWKSPDELPQARKDLYISIPLGGLISIAIVSTAASAFFGKSIAISSAADLAPALQPFFGDSARIFMACGLFAAGISSAVTAPLAAAFALNGMLNLNKSLDDIGFKLIWMLILIIGIVVATSGYKPISIIWFAQVANGILLPIITLYLLWIMNSAKLAKYKNNWKQNALGFLVLAITLMLSGKSLISAFGKL